MKAAEDHSGTAKRPRRLGIEFRSDVIALISTDAESRWTEVEKIRLDAPDFADEVNKLRRTAQKLSGKTTPVVDLMLPAAQVLSFDAPPHVIAKNRFLRHGAVATSLAGRSPVPASDLSYDWAINADGTSGISAVERSVVDEACVYARRWGFQPRRVTSHAGHPAFANGPTFSAKHPYQTKAVMVGAGVAATFVLALGIFALWPNSEPDAPFVADVEIVEPVVAVAVTADATEPPAAQPEPEFFTQPPAKLSAGILANDKVNADPPVSLTGHEPAPTTALNIGPTPFDLTVATAPAIDTEGAVIATNALPTTEVVILNTIRDDLTADLGPDVAAILAPDVTPAPSSLVLNEPGIAATLTEPLSFDPSADTAPVPAMALAPPVPRPGSGSTAPQDEEANADEAVEADEAAPAAPPSEIAAEDVAPEPEASDEAELDDENIPGPGAVASSPTPQGRPDHLDMTPSKLAVASAPRPSPRPASIKPRPPVIATASGETPKTVRAPSRGAPSGPGVANAATLKAAIQLEEMNLLGVFGSKSSRRALLRMPDGQIMRVTKGTVVDGWVVSRIDAASMRMTRGGTAQTLNVAR